MKPLSRMILIPTRMMIRVFRVSSKTINIEI